MLGGTWADQGQYLVSKSAGHALLNFSARDVYIVAGPESGTIHATVTVDGNPISPQRRGPDLRASGLEVTSQQLYHVLQGEGGDRRLIDVAVPAGFRLYTFTFG